MTTLITPTAVPLTEEQRDAVVAMLEKLSFQELAAVYDNAAFVLGAKEAQGEAPALVEVQWNFMEERVTIDGDDPANVEITLACPYCGEDASDAYVIDSSERWVEFDEIDGDERVVTVNYSETADYEGVGYAHGCGPGSRNFVSLPQGWLEQAR